MTVKDKRTIALANPSFEIVIKYANPTMGTGYSSQLMDELSDKLKDAAERVIIDHLKANYEQKEEIIFNEEKF